MIRTRHLRFESGISTFVMSLLVAFFATTLLGLERPILVSPAPGGGYLVSGLVEFAGGTRSVTIAKLLPDGQLDPTFGFKGRTAYDFSSDYLHDIRHSTDAKRRIIATCVVYLPTPSGARYTAVAVRFNADGSLDRSFGEDGVFQYSESPGAEFLLTVTLEDGKILIVGASELIRLNEDGSRDATFGTDGVAPIGNNLRGFAVGILLQDGRILISSDTHGILAITQTGIVDPAFTNPKSQLISNYRVLCQQDDGKIVVAEATWGSGGERTRFARFNLSGNVDMGFGTNGFYEPPQPAFYPIQILGSADGGIVGVANRTFTPTASYSTWIFRLGEDGTLDSNFGLANARGERFPIDESFRVQGDGIQSVLTLPDGGCFVVAKEENGLDGCRGTRLLPDGSSTTSFFQFSFPKLLLSHLPIDREYGAAGEYRVPVSRQVKTYRAGRERRKRFLVYAAECGLGRMAYRPLIDATEDDAADLQIIYAGGGNFSYIPDDNLRYLVGKNGLPNYFQPYNTARYIVQFTRSPQGQGKSFARFSLQAASRGAKTSLLFRIVNPTATH